MGFWTNVKNRIWKKTTTPGTKTTSSKKAVTYSLVGIFGLVAIYLLAGGTPTFTDFQHIWSDALSHNSSIRYVVAVDKNTGQEYILQNNPDSPYGFSRWLVNQTTISIFGNGKDLDSNIYPNVEHWNGVAWENAGTVMNTTMSLTQEVNTVRVQRTTKYNTGTFIETFTLPIDAQSSVKWDLTFIPINALLTNSYRVAYIFNNTNTTTHTNWKDSTIFFSNGIQLSFTNDVSKVQGVNFTTKGAVLQFLPQTGIFSADPIVRIGGISLDYGNVKIVKSDLTDFEVQFDLSSNTNLNFDSSNINNVRRYATNFTLVNFGVQQLKNVTSSVTENITTSTPWTHNVTDPILHNSSMVTTQNRSWSLVTSQVTNQQWSDTINLTSDPSRVRIIATKKATVGGESVDIVPQIGTFQFNSFTWWNTSFTNKKPENITSNLTSSITNAIYWVNWTRSSNDGANCNDFRWINGTEDTSLPYYTEACNSSTIYPSYMIVNDSLSSGTGVQTRFRYYGYPSAENVSLNPSPFGAGHKIFYPLENNVSNVINTSQSGTNNGAIFNSTDCYHSICMDTGNRVGYVSPDSNTWLDIYNQPITVAMWVKFYRTDIAQGLLEMTNTNRDGLFDYNGRNVGKLTYGCQESSSITYSWTPQKNVWYHLAATQTAGAGGTETLYINGNQVATSTNGCSSSGSFQSGRYDVGRLQGGTIGAMEIDDFILSNSVYSADQIMALANTTNTEGSSTTNNVNGGNITITFNGISKDRTIGVGFISNISLTDTTANENVCVSFFNIRWNCGNSNIFFNVPIPNDTIFNYTDGSISKTVSTLSNISINMKANVSLGNFEEANVTGNGAVGFAIGFNGTPKMTFDGNLNGNNYISSVLSNKSSNTIVIPTGGSSVNLTLNFTVPYDITKWSFGNITLNMTNATVNSQTTSITDNFINNSLLNLTFSNVSQNNGAWVYEDGTVNKSDRYIGYARSGNTYDPSIQTGFGGVRVGVISDHVLQPGGESFSVRPTDFDFSYATQITYGLTLIGAKGACLLSNSNGYAGVYDQTAGSGSGDIISLATITNDGSESSVIVINGTSATWNFYKDNSLIGSFVKTSGHVYVPFFKNVVSCASGGVGQTASSTLTATYINVSGIRGSYGGSMSWNNATVSSNPLQNFTRAIVSMILNANVSIPSGSSINWFLSPDGGNHWESTTLGTVHTFIQTGYNISWRADVLGGSSSESGTGNIPLNFPLIKTITLTSPSGNPSNITIDVGADGTNEYSSTSTLVTTLASFDPSASLINYITGPNCAGLGLTSCSVPIGFTSGTQGSFTVSNVSFPAVLNSTAFNFTDISNRLMVNKTLDFTIWPGNGSITMNHLNFTLWDDYNLTIVANHPATPTTTGSSNTSVLLVRKNWPIDLIPQSGFTFPPILNISTCGDDGALDGCFQNGTFLFNGENTTSAGWVYNINNTDSFNINTSVMFNQNIIVPGCIQTYMVNSSSNIYNMQPKNIFNITNISETKILFNVAPNINQTLWIWEFFNGCGGGEQLSPNITFTTNQSFYP